jgi:peptidoglycan/xylan/chitin deacetylase (PgdA/CDA1 family)
MTGNGSMTPIPVLVYHSVCATPPKGLDRWTVTPETFAAQLDAVQESGRTPLTIGELAGGLRGDLPLPPEAVALTFDDGFADNADALAEVLQRGLRATLYVTTGYLGRPGMLSGDGLRDLASLDGLELGAHSVTHPRLDELPAREIAHEVSASCAMLEDVIGREVTTFAYPHGNHHRGVRAAVIAAGLDSAAAVKNAFSHAADDPFGIARWIVEADTPTARFEEVLDGRGLPLAWPGERFITRGYRIVRRARHMALRATTRPTRSRSHP